MNCNKPIFTGAATALVTPFTDGEVDYASFADIIEYQISEGIDALVVCGTTGEAATLTIEERNTLVSFAVDVSDGRVPIIAGTGSNSTHRTISLSEDAEKAGANGLLVITPYCNKASRDGIIEHYHTLARAVDLPIIVYNVPSRTGVSLSPEVYSELLSADNIVGIKEANGNVSSCVKTLALSPEADLYSGNDGDTLPILSIGGKGVISVVSNILPHRVHDMCAYSAQGKNSEASKIARELCFLTDALFSDVNPIPIKFAMSLLSFCNNELRLPLTPLSFQNRERLLECMRPFFKDMLNIL